MGKKPQHKNALVASAIRLFRRRGYAGTGTKDILADSGAPRGSLYHYFPGGKEEIGATAVQAAGERVTATLRSLADEAESPAAFIRRYLGMLEGWMADSGFRDGCPIATTLLETAPDSERIRQAGEAAMGDWQRCIEALLRDHGWPAARAASLAGTAIAAIEGAMLMARVQASPVPLRQAAEDLAGLLSTEVG